MVPTKSGYVTVKGLPRSIDEKKVDLINKKMLAREDGKIMEYGEVAPADGARGLIGFEV